nr:NADH dehydrogenase subunit 2 [Orthopagus splendens]
MKTNSSTMMFLFMIFTSMFMTISSNMILFTWMTMELNMIVFMPIMTKTKKMKDFSMKYLIIQSTSSSLMLMAILTNLMIECPINESIMLMTSMLMKLGMIPFHLWMPNLFQSSSWMICLMMSTIQKIIPTTITSQMIQTKLIFLPMMLSMMMAPIISINQTSLKKILAYSSISNTPMMLITMMVSKSHFIMFFITYSIINASIMSMLKKLNLNFLNQMNNKPKINKMMILINMLSISGMPPLLGFFPKWISIQMSMQMSMILTTSIISSSILSTFIYMNLMTPILMNSSTKISYMKTLKSEEILTIVNLTGMPLTLILKFN